MRETDVRRWASDGQAALTVEYGISNATQMVPTVQETPMLLAHRVQNRCSAANTTAEDLATTLPLAPSQAQRRCSAPAFSTSSAADQSLAWSMADSGETPREAARRR